MKPSCRQLFFAGNWPIKIWLGIVAVVSVCMAGRTCEPTLSALHDWRFLILFAGVIVIAPILVGYTSLFFVWPLLFGPLYRVRGRLNGAPYRIGDYVQILVGPDRGRVVVVDEVWEQRGQVCVELGRPRIKGIQFAFAQTQIFRVPTQNAQALEIADAK